MSSRPRTPDEERAYGSQHRARRKQLLAALEQIGAAPCPRCGEAMSVGMDLHLDHSNPDGKQYGMPGDVLCHARCNTAAGGRLGHAIRAAAGAPRPLTPAGPAISEQAISAALGRLSHHEACRCRARMLSVGSAPSRCW